MRTGGAALASLRRAQGKTIGVSASTTFQRSSKRRAAWASRVYATDADAVSDVGDGTPRRSMIADTTVDQ